MVLAELKLGTLVLKTFTKPLATRLKKHAGIHPNFRNFIVKLAQANHRMTTTVHRYVYGHSTDVKIHPLNQEKAVQSATDLMGELFVFSVAVAALGFEVTRSGRSEAKKEELRRQEIEGMKKRDVELARAVELLKQKSMEIERILRGHNGLPGVFSINHALSQESPYVHPFKTRSQTLRWLTQMGFPDNSITIDDIILA